MFPTVSAIPASAIGNGLTNFLPAVGLPSKAILSDLPIGVVKMPLLMMVFQAD